MPKAFKWLPVILFMAGCSINPASPTISPTALPAIEQPVPTNTLVSTTTPEPNIPVRVDGKPLEQPFPRLGMWWPDTRTQSVDEISRYDWVILTNSDLEFIPALKQRNPDMIILNSDNACEVSYNSYPDSPLEENAGVRSLPAEWFLTQVGTSITTDLDDAVTTIPVAAVRAGSGEQAVDLFIPGDTAVLEGESVYIESVDPVNLTLQVRRGFVRPAARHAAGARIAAHISFWPNSWVMNMSSMSPAVVFEGNTSPETWSSFHARSTAAYLSDPSWDGILLDRSDGNESWLIGNSTARSIDPDQSNRLPTDYFEFDTAWNSGMVAYEMGVRKLVGDSKIIYTNWGMPNYPILNGNNFEGFPGDEVTSPSFISDWHRLVFGPDAWTGSYFDWMQQSRQPNLTMIETYEDNSGPSPTSDGIYSNTCKNPTFRPDYRKMRFGFGTALLNDGFFSYEMNTNGHGSLCLMWFDEYDGGGIGQGYLGRPLGPAYLYPVTDPIPVPISTDPNDWYFWFDDSAGYGAKFIAEGQVAVIQVTQSKGTDWQVTYSQAGLQITDGEEYELTFLAKADSPHPVSMTIQQSIEPWDILVDLGSIQPVNTWQQYTVRGVASGDDANAELYFNLGAQTGTVMIDQVKLVDLGKSIWRRDFTHGTVLLNATSDEQLVTLETEFQRIKGFQDPLVNNGAKVTELTLPALDAVILLNAE